MIRSLACLLVAALLVVGCADASAPGTESAEPAVAPAAPAAPEPQTVADIFPPGEGRDLALNSCGSCHNVACSAIGQRPTARWAALKNGHKEYVSSASDLDTIFTYLETHFGESQPAPNVPPRFLEGGCTPF